MTATDRAAIVRLAEIIQGRQWPISNESLLAAAELWEETKRAAAARRSEE